MTKQEMALKLKPGVKLKPGINLKTETKNTPKKYPIPDTRYV